MKKVSIWKTSCSLKFISLFCSFILVNNHFFEFPGNSGLSVWGRMEKKEKTKRKKSWFQIKGMAVFSNKCKNPAYFIQFLVNKRPQMGYFQKCFVNLVLHFCRISWFGWTNVSSAYMQIRTSINRNFLL